MFSLPCNILRHLQQYSLVANGRALPAKTTGYYTFISRNEKSFGTKKKQAAARIAPDLHLIHCSAID
jgi:hypothetical protein